MLRALDAITGDIDPGPSRRGGGTPGRMPGAARLQQGGHRFRGAPAAVATRPPRHWNQLRGVRAIGPQHVERSLLQGGSHARAAVLHRSIRGLPQIYRRGGATLLGGRASLALARLGWRQRPWRLAFRAGRVGHGGLFLATVWARGGTLKQWGARVRRQGGPRCVPQAGGGGALRLLPHRLRCARRRLRGRGLRQRAFRPSSP
mmetsp:Transcript_71103/g.197512  ORF Transcript_71103/g.197512 Transcript_71103/m.197512 type:complete len:203 (-) Transcript_71103:244-852(-)